MGRAGTGRAVSGAARGVSSGLRGGLLLFLPIAATLLLGLSAVLLRKPSQAQASTRKSLSSTDTAAVAASADLRPSGPETWVESPRAIEEAKKDPVVEESKLAAAQRKINEDNVRSLIDALVQCSREGNGRPKVAIFKTLARYKDVARPALDRAIAAERDAAVVEVLQEAKSSLE